MNRRVLVGCVLSVASLVCAEGIRGARADERTIPIAVSSFAEAEDRFQLNGAAVVEGASLKLNPAAGNLYGTAFYKQLVTLPSNRSFSAYFTFRITNPDCGTGGGADGLAFVVQTDSTAVGSMGGGIGYAGILPAVAIEFDTFKNDGFKDPDDNHIGIGLGGDPESLATAPAPVHFIDGNTHHAWIDYDGSEDQLEVRLSSSPERPEEAAFSYTTALEDELASQVYVGFTAATGSCNEQHDIRSFYFSNDFIPGGIDLTSGSFVGE